ncbi:ATP-binding protein [Blastomonas aquatica]|uniref:histidine kinase n=1 Tax=Blastomonas aquatica TaxID=1510276 RepID=A0ABQ1JDL8_9SPHN|nr:ATP-binding protein [Blastomonas aquatica]GGB66280.1 two-component sensor histidine kinase [Blastomonas aquatica]
MIPASAPEVTDAVRRNMALLIQLRWLAVGGQLLTILVVHGMMEIPLPLAPLLAALLLLVLINLGTLYMLKGHDTGLEYALFAALLFDIAALTWQLHFTGGLANPFAALFLLQVVIGAMLLRPSASWTMVAATLCALAILAADSVPLALPPGLQDDEFSLYLQGSFVCFALIAVLLVAFVTRIARNLRERDSALASIRQRAAEEDHIVRMGLLASGAAHELGTPLATLSVLVNDFRAMPELKAMKDLDADLSDMETAVHRCKTIVSGILMSAGEARGEAPERTTMRAFLTGIADEWREARGLGVLEFHDRFGADIAIVSDPALRQVIGNVIDNAIDVSPDWVRLEAAREGDTLALSIVDHGPGFPDEILEGLGKPYRSTKGRPGGGLGLFLLVNVLRKLGGEVRAGNREGGGARVTMLLPLAAIAYPAGEKA